MDGRPAASATSGARPWERDLHGLLLAAGLCNNARLVPPGTENPHWTILGDPTEAALRVAAQKGGIDLEAEARRTPRLRELPFDSRRKRMSTIHTDGNGQWVYVKGAPKEVLALCTHLRQDGQELSLDASMRSRVMSANDEYARNGLRVLVVATRVLPGPSGSGSTPRPYSPEAIESDLTFLGLMAMMDPPRPEVAEAVQKCHSAGIRIIMITGDYGLTAESIAPGGHLCPGLGCLVLRYILFRMCYNCFTFLVR